MDALAFIIGGVLPYVAVFVFLAAMIYRFSGWFMSHDKRSDLGRIESIGLLRGGETPILDGLVRQRSGSSVRPAQLPRRHAHRPVVLEQKVDPIASAKLVLQLEDSIRAKVRHGGVLRHVELEATMGLRAPG